MDVVVLGGAGAMGSYSVEWLAEATGIDRLVAADANPDGASAVAELPSAGFEPVDVTDHAALVALLEDFDVAVNCVGPFYRFAQPVVDGAIEAGTSLVDICDDYDVTEALLADHDAAARDAGVTVLLGMGASPGITNVLARRGADRLDDVDRIDVRVTRGAGEATGPAIPYHVFNSWLGGVPTYRDGGSDTVQALRDGAEVTTFPEPFGPVTTYHFGHPETVTLPRTIEGVDNVSCKGALLPEAVREALLGFQELGLTDTTPLSIDGHDVRPLDVAAAQLERLSGLVGAGADDVPEGGAVVVEVTGVRDGRDRVERFAGTARMREATGAAAAMGATLVGDGTIDAPGVQPPEACVPVDTFVDAMLDEPGFSLWEGSFERRGGDD